MRRRSFAIALALSVAACKSGSDYRPPESATTATGAFVTRAPAFDPVAPVPDDWWRLYADPALDDLVSRALAANMDLRVAAANLVRARAVVDEARALRFPLGSVSGGLEYGDSQNNGGQNGGSQNQTSAGAQWSQNAGVSVSWELDLFGRIARTIEAARADAQAAEAVRDAVRVTVAAETTRAYLNACSAAYALNVARESARASDETLRIVSAQERAGSVGRFDVERAAAAAATARAAIPEFEGLRRSALFELAALLGATPSEVPASAAACANPPAPVAAIPVGDGAQMLRRRPDLREAERRLAADTARIGVAIADLYPQISLGGSGNFFRNDTVRGGDSFSFSIGPLISWSVGGLGVARTRIRQAEAQGEASLATFDGRVLTALKEVEQALSMVDTGQRRLDSLREAQTRAEQAYCFAQLRYRAGSVSQLDVLVAQADLLSARSAYAAQVQRLASARVDLFKALGGGWQRPAEAGPGGRTGAAPPS